MGAKLAAVALPKRRTSRISIKVWRVYVATLSKAAHLPEYFVDRVPCPSTPAARTQLVPDYINALRREGIHVVDTASLIHSLKGTYPFDLFPQGGVHRNDVGGARRVSRCRGDQPSGRARDLFRPSSSPIRCRSRRKAPIASSKSIC